MVFKGWQFIKTSLNSSNLVPFDFGLSYHKALKHTTSFRFAPRREDDQTGTFLLRHTWPGELLVVAKAFVVEALTFSRLIRPAASVYLSDRKRAKSNAL